MKAARDATILLVLVVLAMTVRISPVDSAEQPAPLSRASLADVLTPGTVPDSAEPAARAQVDPAEDAICPNQETQVFVLELDEAIGTLREVAPRVLTETQTVVRRICLDCT